MYRPTKEDLAAVTKILGTIADTAKKIKRKSFGFYLIEELPYDDGFLLYIEKKDGNVKYTAYNDHDVHGKQGITEEIATRIVKSFQPPRNVTWFQADVYGAFAENIARLAHDDAAAKSRTTYERERNRVRKTLESHLPA